jgi:hypothetical protein
MNSRLSLAEMRDLAIAEKTAAHAATIRAAVEAGEPPIGLIADGVNDLLCDAELAQAFAFASLVFPAFAGAGLNCLTEQVIAEQAEFEAIKEVARMERDRQESYDEGRIERAVYEQDMRLFGWGGMS